MIIPKRVKIGGHWFAVEYRNENNDGYFKTGTKYTWLNKIFLQKDAVQSKRESCLLHEIIHEIDWQNELNLDEKQVATLGENIYQVLIDNKLLK